ncbi:MAG: hypothetical protein WDW38_007430 [Sanguina aurantia]
MSRGHLPTYSDLATPSTSISYGDISISGLISVESASQPSESAPSQIRNRHLLSVTAPCCSNPASLGPTLPAKEDSFCKRVSFASESSQGSLMHTPRASWGDLTKAQPQPLLRQCLAKSNPQHPVIMLPFQDLPRTSGPLPLWQRQQQLLLCDQQQRQQQLLSERLQEQQRQKRHFALHSVPQETQAWNLDREALAPPGLKLTPRSPLEHGWWDQTEQTPPASPQPPICQSSPQQQDWREFAYPKPSSNLTPRHQRMQEASGLSSPCNIVPDPSAHHVPRVVASSTHIPHARAPASKLSSPQLSSLRVATYDRSPRDCVKHSGSSVTSSRAARMHPTCNLSHAQPPAPAPLASLSSPRFKLSSLIPAALSTVFTRHHHRQHTVHRLSSDRHCTAYYPSQERNSASSDGSVAPTARNRWPGAEAPSSPDPTTPEQAVRYMLNMEVDYLAMANLTLRYSQEADSPGCQVARRLSSASSPRSSSHSLSQSLSNFQDILVSGFSHDPVSPHVSSRFSRDAHSRAPRVRQSFDAAAMASSSLLYHTSGTGMVIAPHAGTGKRTIRLGDASSGMVEAATPPSTSAAATGQPGQQRPAAPPRMHTITAAPAPHLSWWKRLTSKRTGAKAAGSPSAEASLKRGQAMLALRVLPQAGGIAGLGAAQGGVT